MKKNELSTIEIDAWRGFRRMGEVITSRIAREITRETGLSAADFSILMQLNMDGSGSQRQRDLQSFLEWDKTRLSHQLTRMAGRGLIERNTEGRNNSVIDLTAEGRRLLSLAEPVHQRGVKAHFSSHFSNDDLEALIRLTDKLRGAL